MRLVFIALFALFGVLAADMPSGQELERLISAANDLTLIPIEFQIMGIPSCMLEVEGAQPGEVFQLYQVVLGGSARCLGLFDYKPWCLGMSKEDVSWLGRIDHRQGGLGLVHEHAAWIIMSGGYMLGEPSTYIIVSTTRDAAAVAFIIPRPLIASDSMGHVLLAQLSDPGLGSFNVVGVGFDPGEVVEVACESGSIRSTSSCTADSQGAVAYEACVRTPEGTGGWWKIIVTDKRGSVELNAPWGTQLTKVSQRLWEAAERPSPMRRG